MLAGPMDFTPGVVSLKGRGGQAIQNTMARQLADYVVLYSPIHMAADLPEHYEQHMDAFQFIRDVPVDWQETHVLNGEVGDYATIVRKDRNSADWYLGSVTDENARTLRCRCLPRCRRTLRRADLPRWRRRGLEDQSVRLRAREPRGHARRHADAEAGRGRWRGDPFHAAEE
jgi:hypothetical protein